MKKMIVAAMAACLSFGIYAANWVYTITSGTPPAATSGTISDGAWTFNASVAKNTSDLTVKEPVDASCQLPAITDLDFSKTVVNSTDAAVEYTIVELQCNFDNHATTKVLVGELTLPGEGLKTIAKETFKNCTKMSGDLRFPSSITSVGAAAFLYSQITSIYMAPTSARCKLVGGYGGNGAFAKCQAMTNLTIAAGGDVMFDTGDVVDNCTKLVKADLSGVTELKLWTNEKGEPQRDMNNGYAHFTGCSALEEVILGAGLTNMAPVSLFGNNGNALSKVRFLGPPPTRFVTPYLYGISTSRKVTTIIPTEYRQAWSVYAADNEIELEGTTWASEYLVSGTALANRPLLLDKKPQSEGPTVWDPTVSGIWTNTATITVFGSGLKGGSIEVSLTNAAGAVTGPSPKLYAFDESYTFETLTPDTTYTVIVAATNDGGTTTNAAVTFRTYSEAEVTAVPTISSVEVSKIAGKIVTVNVNGADLGTGANTGSFRVEIYDDNGQLVTTSASVTGWGSVRVAGLDPETSYYARAIATHGLSGRSATSSDVAFATTFAGWLYDSDAQTIFDGDWTFTAKIDSTYGATCLAIGNIVDGGHPTEISPLDFSQKILKKDDKTVEYTITTLNALFWYYSGGDKYKDGGQYVGKFTLPGEGLVIMEKNGLDMGNNATYSMFGDIVIPSTVTKIERYWFRYTKINSITFEAGTATIGSEICNGCKALTSVVFRVGGSCTIGNNARPFSSCTALKNADLSGVISVGGDSSHSAFGSCSEMTNMTLNSNIVLSNTGSGSIGNALFNSNGKLATIRFTGAAPNDLPNWISGDGGYLGLFDNSREITTIVPADYRNIKNSNNMSWEDYSASGELNTSNSTWKASYVKSGVTLSNRKLILDKEPKKEGPTVLAPTVSDIWTNAVTITANGGGEIVGKIEVSLTNAQGTVTGPMEVDAFGDSCDFDGLAPHTEYTVIVVARNTDGVTTNATTTFTTYGMTTLAARAVYTASDTTLTFRYDGVDWSEVGTVYEVGDGSGSAWAAAHKATLTRVVFKESFKSVRPTSCASWFLNCTLIASIEGLEYLDTRDVTTLNDMFNNCDALTTIDLSAFRTPKLTNSQSMFYECDKLTTIWANENFVNYYTSGNFMFRKSPKIVGGNGTSNSDSTYQDSQYARVDRPGVPGLFTYKDQPELTEKPTVLAYNFHDRTTEGGMLNIIGMDLTSTGTVTITAHPADDPTAVAATITVHYLGEIAITGLQAGQSYVLDIEVENSVGSVALPQQTIKTKRVAPEGATAKVVFDDTNLTMTFYFDTSTHEGDGTVYAVGDAECTWKDHSTKASITNATFDASFLCYYPKSCKQWFSGFNNLVSISSITNLDTSETTSMSHMFSYANSLTTLDVSGFDTANVTDMSSMFYKCGARVLDLTGFNTAKVTTMNSMFQYSAYDRLNLSSFNTANVSDMSGMFSNCGVNQICVGENWSTAKVAAKSVVFGGNTTLVGGAGTAFTNEHVDVSYARVDNPPSAPGYFTYLKSGAPVILSVIVSDISTNAATVTVYGEGLKEGSIEVALTNAESTVSQPLSGFGESCTFNALEMLTSYGVIVAASNSVGVTTNATVTFTTAGITNLAARATYTASDTTLMFTHDTVDRSGFGTVYEVGDGSDPAWATVHAATLTRVVFDPTFRDAQPTSCANWFGGCALLTSVDAITNLNTSAVTTMANMFNGCNAITALDLSAFRTPQLVATASMFEGCYNLTTIWANENFVNYYITSGVNMFKNASKLQGENGSTIATTGIGPEAARVDRAGAPGLFTYKAQPAVTAKPTILAYEFHDRSTNSVMLNLVGTDFGANGNVTIEVRRADDPATVVKTVEASYLGDIAITGLLPGTSYLFDVVASNAHGSATVPRQTLKTKRVAPEGAWAKVVFDDDNLTMTFYFDDKEYDEFKREGETNVYAIADSGSTWTKHGTIGSVTNATFDASFLCYYPESCKNWFAGFGKLAKIDGIGNLDTSDVTSMNSMFMHTDKLTTLDVSGFDTAQVTDMAEMFRSCGAKTLDLTGFNTAKVKTMSAMFQYTGYDRLNLSAFDTANVTVMANMFEHCVVSAICVGDGWSTEKVPASTVMFGNNGSLTGGAGTAFTTNHVDVSYARVDGGPESETPGYLTYLKAGAPSIFSVVVSGVTTNSATVTVYGEGLLGGTIEVSLTNAIGEVVGPKAMTTFGGSCTFDTLEMNTGYAVIAAAGNASGVSTNATVTFRTAGVTTLAARATYTAYDTTLTFTYDACDRSGFGTVYEVGDGSNPIWASTNAATLTRVVFDPSFTNAQPTTCAKWFYECKKLASVEGLNYLNAGEVTDMNNMFGYCSVLTTLDLSALRTPKLAKLEYTFSYCSALTTIWANENFVSYNAVGNMTFHNSNRLVGENGTDNAGNAYTSSKYARVDRAGTPGLFKYKEQPELTSAPTILATDFHDRTSEGGLFNIVGMDLGSSGTITVTVHPATNETEVVTNIVVTSYGDVTLTGLAPDTSYLIDVAATNAVGGTVLPGVSIKTRREAPEGATAKVVFSDGVMTFYYDDVEHEGSVYEIQDTGCTWSDYAVDTVSNAIFDASFRSYYPKSCKQWFAGFTALETIANITNLDTSEVTSMADMFRQTSVLSELDLRHFDTANVTDMSGMFRQVGVRVLDITSFNTAKVTTMSEMFAYWCPNKINVSSFNTSNVTAMTGMFTGCKVNQISASELWSTEKIAAGTKVFGSNLGADKTLTGQAGTAYKAGNDDVSYARLDEGDAAPGYFTYARPGEKPDTLPDVTSIVISGISTNAATVTVSGTELDSGNIYVEIYDNDWKKILTSGTIDDWGSIRVSGLQPASLYYARVIATNGESKKSLTCPDVDFVTASQTDIAWVTLKDASSSVADDGKSADFSVRVNTCNVDGEIVLVLNGVEKARWTISAGSEGTTFTTNILFKPYVDYTWQFQAGGTAQGVKALTTSGGSFTASVREPWVDVAFEGGGYDISTGESPSMVTNEPEGVWTQIAKGGAVYEASEATGAGNDVRIEGEVEAYAVDEDDVPSGTKAAFGFVAYDGALKPAVWANGAWHAFGFRVFTPGDTIAYTLSFDFIADVPCVRAVVGSETSDWYEVDASPKSLDGFVFKGGAKLGAFRGWRYKAKPPVCGLVIVFD